MIDQAIRDALAPLLDPIRTELAGVRDELRRMRAAIGAGRWVSRREAAEALGISVDSVDRRIADKGLRARRIGRAVRVLLEPLATDQEIAALAAEARRG